MKKNKKTRYLLEARNRVLNDFLLFRVTNGSCLHHLRAEEDNVSTWQGGSDGEEREVRNGRLVRGGSETNCRARLPRRRT